MNFHTLFHAHIFRKNTNGMDQIDCRLKIIGTKLTKYTSTPKINKYIKWLQIAVLVALHSNFQSQHLRIYALWYPLEEVHLEQNSTWIGANSSSIAFQSQNLSFHALRDLQKEVHFRQHHNRISSHSNQYFPTSFQHI